MQICPIPIHSFSDKIAHLSVQWSHMSHSAIEKSNILHFWRKHGLSATLDAFDVKERTLYYGKNKYEGFGELGLNNQNKSLRKKRQRHWDKNIVDEIAYYRQQYPNLGKDKLS